MRKILQYLRPRDWGYALVSLLFILAQVWLDLKLPDYMDEITLLVQAGNSPMADILAAGGMMLLCALGSMVATIIVGYFAAKIAAGLAMRLRAGVYDRTMEFGLAEIGRFSTASLITRSTNDITQVQMFVAMGLQAMVKAPIMAVWAIVKIAGKSWQWTAVTGVAVLFLVIMLAVILWLCIPRFTRVQTLTDALNRITRENLTGIRVVRAYNAEQYQEKKFDAANSKLTAVNRFTQRAMAFQQPGMRLIISGLTLGIYWVGAYMIDAAPSAEKAALFADMVVFSSYAMQIIMSFMMLTITFVILPRTAVSVKRICEVLNTEPSMKDGVIQQSELFEQGEIEFRHVSFRYPGAADDVLHDVSFTAKKGETVAFIGSTGSGKSTLVQLVPRFYDVTEGEVLVDGVNVREYTQHALRCKLGYVPQRPVLFRGTIAGNVCYGDNGEAPAQSDEIEEALEIAQASDFVHELEDGCDARVAQAGSNFSGGQKQRISIARAVCRKPEIYIFDDAFSALDYKTDRALRTALRKRTAGVTTLIVAQRIGTILDADQIIVLDEGRVVGKGTHKELLKNCPVYREIALSQLSREDLDKGGME